MAFAPHTNTDVHNSKNYTKQFPLLLGSFVEKEKRNIFEYAVRPDEGIDFAPDCPHIVYVTNVIDGIDMGYRMPRFSRLLLGLLSMLMTMMIQSTTSGKLRTIGSMILHGYK